MYMHVLGRGDPVKLATLLHDALAESKTPMAVRRATPGTAPPLIDPDTAALDRTLGAKGSEQRRHLSIRYPAR